MSTIIKATSRLRGNEAVPFNLDDLVVQGDKYLEGIRNQARELLAKAATEAELVRKKAEIEGRRAAEAAIDQLLDRKVAEQMQTVLPALRAVVKSLEEARPGWLSHWERRAVHLAGRIAARVLRRELARDPQVALPLVREALELARGSSEIRVLLNHEDHQALGPQVRVLATELARAATVDIVADERITRGGCRVETRHGAVDQQLDVQLGRIEEELTDAE